MYARRISNNFIPQQHNLRNVIVENSNEKGFQHCSLVIKRQFSDIRSLRDLKGKLEMVMDSAKAYKRLLFSKTSPEKTLKTWAQQFEFVFAHRVRRGQQMICLYSKWWEEKALKEFLKRLRISINRSGKEFLLGALGVSLYDWEQKRIADEEFQTHLDDLKYINALKEATMCLSCSKGEHSERNTRICKCGTGGVSNKTYDDWVPFIEKDDLVVWRRPHGEGLFEYKVYGSYHDVSAEDFLNTQVDTDYRKEWDTTAIQLEIGERDLQADSNSDILYWEMQWPRLFVNRDYVFNRRYKVFNDSQTIVIINKTTDYPRFPKYPDKYRVEEYWSCMVIKPYEKINQPGIEFSLTYFDNPGVNIPASVTTWVAKSAMPDYLAKLRHASKNYLQYCIKKGTGKACELYQNAERERREAEERTKLDYCSNNQWKAALKEILDDFQIRANVRLFRQSELVSAVYLDPLVETPTKTDDNQPQQSTSNNPKPPDGFWRYLHPFYYFT